MTIYCSEALNPCRSSTAWLIWNVYLISQMFSSSLFVRTWLHSCNRNIFLPCSEPWGIGALMHQYMRGKNSFSQGKQTLNERKRYIIIKQHRRSTKIQHEEMRPIGLGRRINVIDNINLSTLIIYIDTSSQTTKGVGEYPEVVETHWGPLNAHSFGIFLKSHNLTCILCQQVASVFSTQTIQGKTGSTTLYVTFGSRKKNF